jgi:hypothetical protein
MMISKLIGCLLLLGSTARASLIFALDDPHQTTSPGGQVAFHGSLQNTDLFAVNIVGFPMIAPPADSLEDGPFPFDEPAIPFTVGAGGTFTGVILTISVPSTALLSVHNFGIAAATDLHDESGLTIVSNTVIGSLTVAVPEPPGISFGLAGLIGGVFLVKRSMGRAHPRVVD